MATIIDETPDAKIVQAVTNGSSIDMSPEGRAKVRSETKKIEAERAAVVSMDRRAEELHVLDMERNRLQVDASQLNLQLSHIMTDRTQREEDIALASDRYHKFYAYNDPINARSVTNCIDQLTEWVRLSPTEKLVVEIVFDSPGGSVIDGMHLFDYISNLQVQGHIINTTALGFAASMAGILLQSGTERSMGPEAYVLIHEVSFAAGGPIGVVEDEVEFVHKIGNRVLDIFARRAAKCLVGRAAKAGKTLDYEKVFDERRDFFEHGKRIVTKTDSGRKTSTGKPILQTKTVNEGGWSRKDWWLNSDEAFEAGFVDKIQGR